MKKSDFQMIGGIGTVLGAIFIASGLFATFYYEVRSNWFYAFKVYPYGQYGFSLLVVGVILLVVGLAFLWRAEIKVTQK